MEFSLPNGVKMEVVGRIDRVDKAEDENGTFLRIIDYKSSSKSLDLTEVYYGLALQMLTYLDVVTSNAQTWMKKATQHHQLVYCTSTFITQLLR